MMQKRDFIRYAAFIKEGCNCARFVTDALIQSTTNKKIRSKLKRSKWFTPSTVGNVVIANTGHMIYELSEEGEIDSFHGSVRKENLKHFLDRLQGHVPNFEGTLHPRKTHGTGLNAQWLGGIAAGAWFELEPTEDERRLRFRRVSPFGHEDTDGLYETQTKGFNPEVDYNFIHYSNCKFFHIDQNGKIYRYDRIAD